MEYKLMVRGHFQIYLEKKNSFIIYKIQVYIEISQFKEDFIVKKCKY